MNRTELRNVLNTFPLSMQESYDQGQRLMPACIAFNEMVWEKPSFNYAQQGDKGLQLLLDEQRTKGVRFSLMGYDILTFSMAGRVRITIYEGDRVEGEGKRLLVNLIGPDASNLKYKSERGWSNIMSFDSLGHDVSVAEVFTALIEIALEWAKYDDVTHRSLLQEDTDVSLGFPSDPTKGTPETPQEAS